MSSKCCNYYRMDNGEKLPAPSTSTTSASNGRPTEAALRAPEDPPPTKPFPLSVNQWQLCAISLPNCCQWHHSLHRPSSPLISLPLLFNDEALSRTGNWNFATTGSAGGVMCRLTRVVRRHTSSRLLYEYPDVVNVKFICVSNVIYNIYSIICEGIFNAYSQHIDNSCNIQSALRFFFLTSSLARPSPLPSSPPPLLLSFCTSVLRFSWGDLLHTETDAPSRVAVFTSLFSPCSSACCWCKMSALSDGVLTEVCVTWF